MKNELLEHLLLDRALGELSTEVSALLDSHLSAHPDAALRSAELTAALRLAHTATTAPAAPAPRPLDVGRLRRAQHAQQSSLRRAQFFRLAACLALGLGLGWLARTPQPQAEITAAPPRRALAVATPRPAASTPGFWSLARLAAHQTVPTLSTAHREVSPQRLWRSPAPLPNPEKKT